MTINEASLDFEFNKGYSQAVQDIQNGKNLRKRMFDFGYNKAIEEIEKLNIWHKEANQMCINKKDFNKLKEK